MLVVEIGSESKGEQSEYYGPFLTTREAQVYIEEYHPEHEISGSYDIILVNPIMMPVKTRILSLLRDQLP